MRIVKADVLNFADYLKRVPLHAEKLRHPNEFLGEVIQLLRVGKENTGLRLPWRKADRFRVREGEVTIWAGINGHRKSMVVGQVMLGLMAQGEEVCIASLEMPPVDTLYRLQRQALARQAPSDERVEFIMEWLDERLWLLDHQGVLEAESIIGLGYYLARELNVKHFVIDSLMKLNIGTDDYNGQKLFINKLCSLAKETGLHVHLVAHARKGRKEADQLDRWSVKGASEITDQAHNVIMVQRNDRDDDDDHDLMEPHQYLHIEKQRNGDFEGTLGFWFDSVSFQLLEYPSGNPIPHDGIVKHIEDRE